MGSARSRTSLLHRVGTDLVRKPEPASLLLKIENDSAAMLLELLQRHAQLIATITAARAEHVAGETGGVQSHRDRLGKIRITDNHRHGRTAEPVSKHNKAGAESGIQGDTRLCCDHERIHGSTTEERHCLSGNANEGEIAADAGAGGWFRSNEQSR